MLIVVFAVVGAILVGAGVFLRVAGGGRFPWIAFYTKGKEAGFSFREIGLLRRVAVESKAENPTALFWSLKQLDRSIRDIVLRLRANGKEENAEANALLAKLFELRKRLEFDLPKYKIGLKSSKNIMVRQRLRITLPGLGPFASIVVENLTRYMACSYPEGPKLPDGFSWRGQTIGVHFWRAEDAGYYYQTKVIDDFSERKYPIIHVAHSDGLVRTQKRSSVRVATDLPGEVFPLKSIDAASDLPEQARGLRCRIQDLSEGGAAVLIGGRAKAGLPVKLQMELGGRTVVMSGIVKSTTFDGRVNRSILHVQARPLGLVTRNRVLTYVYNLLGDRDEAPALKKRPPAPAPRGEAR